MAVQKKVGKQNPKNDIFDKLELLGCGLPATWLSASVMKLLPHAFKLVNKSEPHFHAPLIYYQRLISWLEEKKKNWQIYIWQKEGDSSKEPEEIHVEFETVGKRSAGLTCSLTISRPAVSILCSSLSAISFLLFTCAVKHLSVASDPWNEAHVINQWFLKSFSKHQFFKCNSSFKDAVNL